MKIPFSKKFNCGSHWSMKHCSESDIFRAMKNFFYSISSEMWKIQVETDRKVGGREKVECQVSPHMNPFPNNALCFTLLNLAFFPFWLTCSLLGYLFYPFSIHSQLDDGKPPTTVTDHRLSHCHANGDRTRWTLIAPFDLNTMIVCFVPQQQPVKLNQPSRSSSSMICAENRRKNPNKWKK